MKASDKKLSEQMASIGDRRTHVVSDANKPSIDPADRFSSTDDKICILLAKYSKSLSERDLSFLSWAYGKCPLPRNSHARVSILLSNAKNGKSCVNKSEEVIDHG